MRLFKSIKFRLTSWYLVVIVGLLVVFGTVAYSMLSRSLYQNLDDALSARANELRATLAVQWGSAVFAGQPDEVLLVYRTNGSLMQQVGADIELADIDVLVTEALTGQDSFMSTTTAEGQEYRLFATAPFSISPFIRVALIVGQPTADIANVLASFRHILLISGLGVIVLAGAGGWFLSSRVLKPVARITRTAQDIGEGDLSRRIGVSGEDELGKLAATLNGMIERLEAAFKRQQQFTSDASHELRTPLAVMQAESSLALGKERSEAEYRKSLELISQEISFMSAIIGKLLFLARSDAGKEALAFEDIKLGQLLTELSPDVEVLAREKGLRFNLGPVDDLTVSGDRVKLRQMFLNLLENAVRYTPAGGSVSASAAGSNGTAAVSISDTGIGIQAEHLPHLFERFYRVDKARSRAEGGAGLGLAISQYIARVHGGNIEVESEPGKGSTFRVLLPLLDNRTA